MIKFIWDALLDFMKPVVYDPVNEATIAKTNNSNYHEHKCNICKTIWRHSSACAGSTKHHKCPNCNNEWRYREWTLTNKPNYIWIDVTITK